MANETWKDEYKKWKNLKPHQIKLLDEGARSQSQAWLLNNMWCDWKDIKKIKEAELPALKEEISRDPWSEELVA